MTTMTVTDTAALIEDVEWMRETREWPPRAAERLGWVAGSLERRLERAGRYDLATWIRPSRGAGS